MEPQPASAPFTLNSGFRFDPEMLQFDDPDVIEVASSSSWSTSSRQKQKRIREQVVPHDVFEIIDDDDKDVLIIDGSSLSYKNKGRQQVKKSAPVKKLKPIIEDEVYMKFKSFKQFDTVQDHSDHYFNNRPDLKIGPITKKPTKNWASRIQQDWKILQKDLPETIFVRVYEDRMDLMRAVIIGSNGTPYHDNLFFFDVYFTPSYPSEPPRVHYHAGGLRLNPNLYACGKVCLSLLNTWSGNGCERWSSSKSNMLQVLLSIQALVLNAKPYFNEPGFAESVNTPYGEKQALDYNEKTFLLSCRTMLYSLRRPPKHFEDFVVGHFRIHGRSILVACRAYMEGAQVGCLVADGVQDVDEGDKSCSLDFKGSLKVLFEELLKEFTVRGADCEEFNTPTAKARFTYMEADTMLRL